MSVYSDKRLTNDRDYDLSRSTPPRDKYSYPYTYDPFTIYGGPNPNANGSVYTDRLFATDCDKTQKIGEEVFGSKSFWFGSHLDPKEVQTFLRRRLGDETLVLTRVVEYCNWSNGYPTWLLIYYKPAEAEVSKTETEEINKS